MKKEKKTLTYTLDESFDPSVISSMNEEELKELAERVRAEIIESCSENGGHLSANLGVVELTIALFRHFHFPEDKLIFDVGHQSYTQKILSGRPLNNLRKENGTDGFQKRKESAFDSYEAGHSSTSISAAMGMAIARDAHHEDYQVIAVIGDASIANGCAFEALNNLVDFPHKMLVILNDNGMSIAQPTGGFNQFLQRVRVSNAYLNTKANYKRRMSKFRVTRAIYQWTAKIKSKIARHLFSSNVFEDIGLYYLGPVDGHNFKKMEKILSKAESINRPCIVHLSTKKGKGYGPAEKDKIGAWHSTHPFDIASGREKSQQPENVISWPSFYAGLLHESMKNHEEIQAITPAMAYGSCLLPLFEDFKGRAFDVGIAEEHALLFASGIAAGGLHPYVVIYSTFLQRAYDELFHDAARMDLPLTLLIDHAGLVGEDGETHQGIYDVSFLNTVPNMKITMASTLSEAKGLMEFSASYAHPLAIRYNKEAVAKEEVPAEEIHMDEWKVIQSAEEKDLCVMSFGPHLAEMKKESGVTYINTLFLNGVDNDVLPLVLSHKKAFIYDPYGTVSGYSSFVMRVLAEHAYSGKITVRSIPDTYVSKGNVVQEEVRYGVDLTSVEEAIRKELYEGK